MRGIWVVGVAALCWSLGLAAQAPEPVPERESREDVRVLQLRRRLDLGQEPFGAERGGIGPDPAGEDVEGGFHRVAPRDPASVGRKSRAASRGTPRRTTSSRASRITSRSDAHRVSERPGSRIAICSVVTRCERITGAQIRRATASPLA